MKVALIAGILSASFFNVGTVTDPAMPEVPAPSVAVIEVPTMFTGTATWFDANRHGRSTWYTRDGITFYGEIGAEVRAVKQHYFQTKWLVRITSRLSGRQVIVQVVDECSCYGVMNVKGDEPLIDLSPAVWQALGVHLGRGVMPITLEILP
jgi:hypothetical protein